MKFLKKLFDLLPTALVVLGSAAVSYGVALIYLPAGIISAGMLAVIGGVLMMLGGDENEQT